MAKIVKSFSFVKNCCMYPWEEWLDGRIWQISRKDVRHEIEKRGYRAGVISMYRFRGSCQNAARTRGGAAMVHLDSRRDIVHLKFVPHPSNKTGKAVHRALEIVDFAKAEASK